MVKNLRDHPYKYASESLSPRKWFVALKVNGENPHTGLAVNIVRIVEVHVYEIIAELSC